MYVFNDSGRHLRVRGVTIPPGRRKLDAPEIKHLGDKGLKALADIEGVSLVDEGTKAGAATLAAAAKAVTADQAALDYCDKLGIKPDDVPRPEGERLTQHHVQLYKVKLEREQGKAAESAGGGAGETTPVELPADWAEGKYKSLMAIAQSLGIKANQSAKALTAAVEEAIAAGKAVVSEANNG